MLIRRRPRASVFALATFVATLALPLVQPNHVFGADVDAGWGELATSGHPITQLEPVYPNAAGEHCALCHWARLLGSSVAGAPTWQQPRAAQRVVTAPATVATSTGPVSAPAPRGPPSIA